MPLVSTHTRQSAHVHQLRSRHLLGTSHIEVSTEDSKHATTSLSTRDIVGHVMPCMSVTGWIELLVAACCEQDGLLDVSFSTMSFAIWNDSATVSVTDSACHAVITTQHSVRSIQSTAISIITPNYYQLPLFKGQIYQMWTMTEHHIEDGSDCLIIINC